MRDSGCMRNASTPALGSSASSKSKRNKRGGMRGGDISSLPGVCEVSSESGEQDEVFGRAFDSFGIAQLFCRGTLEFR
jgi:hypothetical protein